jgi:quercetin dioxygenase-like cupin family protein
MELEKTGADASIWPQEISTLPKVVVPVSGVTGYCLGNAERQIVFFDMEEGTSFPDHSHCAQWGTVVAGEMTLEVDGHTELYQPGDTYHIPEGVRHRASFSQRTFLIDLFAAPDRYEVQPR